MGFPGGSVVKNLPVCARYAGDMDSFPGLGRSSGKGNGNTVSILAWKIPWTEELGRLQVVMSQPRQSTHAVFHCTYVYLLYPFICWWTFRLHPYSAATLLGVYIGVHVSFQIQVFSSSMPRSTIVGSHGNSNFLVF